MHGFEAMGLGPRLTAVLAGQAIDTPTPVQAQAIPALMAGRDVVALAQTGTGKTLAFALPLVRKIEAHRKPKPRTISALVLSPTRELAAQTLETLRGLAEGTTLGIVQATGGVPADRQAARLAHGCDILVATPGRLTDLLEQGALTLDHMRHLVLDEADRMLDMGFAPALRRLRRNMPRERQTVMTTATMPEGVAEIAADWMEDPLTIDLSPPARVADGIAQRVHFTTQGDKARVLLLHLQTHPGEAALVFTRTRERAEKLADLLVHWGLTAGALHGERKQGQRDRVLEAFRDGQLAVLVATDIAARGLDVPTVRHVYNHDLPVVADTYVHRIGRTARAGATGTAVSLVAPAEMVDLAAIEALTGQPLAVVGGTPWPAAMAEDARRKAGLPLPKPEGGDEGAPRPGRVGHRKGPKPDRKTTR
jgi:ATP-dependent RNA helicase RhlE